MKPDLPVRLFRNHKGIKFFGVCHEHPETEVNKGVGPVLLMSDVFIAHDGYLTEAVRRNRFLRNINLVIKDRGKYPERKLGKFLWLRDLIHLCRYRLEQTGMLDNDVNGWATEAANLFEEEYLNGGNMDDAIMVDAIGYYSEANKYLNRGHEMKFSLGLNGIGEKTIVGRFADSKKAGDFVKQIVENNLKVFEDRYY